MPDAIHNADFYAQNRVLHNPAVIPPATPDHLLAVPREYLCLALLPPNLTQAYRRIPRHLNLNDEVQIR